MICLLFNLGVCFKRTIIYISLNTAQKFRCSLSVKRVTALIYFVIFFNIKLTQEYCGQSCVEFASFFKIFKPVVKKQRIFNRICNIINVTNFLKGEHL